MGKKRGVIAGMYIVNVGFRSDGDLDCKDYFSIFEWSLNIC